MWHLVTWFSGVLGSAGLMAGLHDLKGLFQPILSMIRDINCTLGFLFNLSFAKVKKAFQ